MFHGTASFSAMRKTHCIGTDRRRRQGGSRMRSGRTSRLIRFRGAFVFDSSAPFGSESKHWQVKSVMLDPLHNIIVRSSLCLVACVDDQIERHPISVRLRVYRPWPSKILKNTLLFKMCRPKAIENDFYTLLASIFSIYWSCGPFWDVKTHVWPLSVVWPRSISLQTTFKSTAHR
jgi:hypothetical protein